MAMLVAADDKLLDKLGSLSTFHGRVLSRVGFEGEADDAFERGTELIDRHGNDIQKFYSAINRAWTDLDRGWVQRAENGFSVARDRAASHRGCSVGCRQDVSLAHAKFGTGDAAGRVDVAGCRSASGRGDWSGGPQVSLGDRSRRGRHRLSSHHRSGGVHRPPASDRRRLIPGLGESFGDPSGQGAALGRRPVRGPFRGRDRPRWDSSRRQRDQDQDRAGSLADGCGRHLGCTTRRRSW